MGEKKLAIVIDDEEFIRALLDRILTGFGYETKLYASALEIPCINSKESHHCFTDERIPDVLISDIQMPGLSGVELIRKIRERNCQIDKIALMTGFSNLNLSDTCKSLECKAFTKPFSLDQIREWLEE